MKAVVHAVLAAIVACGLSAAGPGQPEAKAYVLGPNDQVRIWALGVEEMSAAPYRIDRAGGMDLPLLGRVQAQGLTLEELKAKLTEGLKKYVKQPDVTVSVADFGSQPVSVIGSVSNPGVHQLQGRKTLVEVLSLAGGLRPEAGHSIKITRALDRGRIPLASAKDDATGGFSVAEVSVKNVMEATKPEENIIIEPGDVISVPRAQMVYVIGQVRKPGGFVLNERESVSVLQALSLAEGLDRTAAPKQARILRRGSPDGQRQEVPVNLPKILAGDAPDVPMESDDILLVPNSTAKSASLRALEAAIQVGTGVVIWRR
jgi:polysaccharide export outer membrane protein